MVTIINYQKMHPEAVVPIYATELSAGADLRSVEEQVVKPMTPTLIHTGLLIELAPGYEAQVRPRSGLALKNAITVLNSPGTIDADYRGEVCVILMNFGTEDFIVHPGDRIAQLVVKKFEQVFYKEVEKLSETERGDGGFGHSGV